MQYEYISHQRDLVRFCDALSGAADVALDTEFVSEDSYRPHLCLAQVEAAGRLAVIDAIAVKDMQVFWERLASGDHRVIVHAGRQELCFFLYSIGQRPQGLFDTQIAAGLIGLEYPAAYQTLVSKLLGKTLHKGETRTDWRRRPLSAGQIEYALQDVVYLRQMRDTLLGKLDALGRRAWMDDEMELWQTGVEQVESHQRWRRVSGIAGLPPRSLAVVRALWRWREAEAERQNRPARRILRDDLLVELARRGLCEVDEIRNVRGMNRRGKQRYLGPIAQAIAQGLALPQDQWPKRSRRRPRGPEFGLLGQFLATALASVCRANHVAPSLVGTVQDIRDFVAWRLGVGQAIDGPPKLARGWRREIVGRVIDDLVAGKRAVRVSDPLAEQPLRFEPSSEEPA